MKHTLAIFAFVTWHVDFSCSRLSLILLLWCLVICQCVFFSTCWFALYNFEDCKIIWLLYQYFWHFYILCMFFMFIHCYQYIIFFTQCILVQREWSKVIRSLQYDISKIAGHQYICMSSAWNNNNKPLYINLLCMIHYRLWVDKTWKSLLTLMSSRINIDCTTNYMHLYLLLCKHFHNK